MWARMAVGALVGLAVGHFLAPGYAMWLTVGVVAGYLAELWTERSSRQELHGSSHDLELP